MKPTLVLAALLLALVGSATSSFRWNTGTSWLTALKKKLAGANTDTHCSSPIWGLWKLGEHSDQDSDDLKALKCRVWKTVCGFGESDDVVSTKWSDIRGKLLSVKRAIWNSDGASVGGTGWSSKRTWSRMWKAVFLNIRALAKSNLSDKCGEWRQKCETDNDSEGGSDSDSEGGSDSGGCTSSDGGGFSPDPRDDEVTPPSATEEMDR